MLLRMHLEHVLFLVTINKPAGFLTVRDASPVVTGRKEGRPAGSRSSSDGSSSSSSSSFAAGAGPCARAAALGVLDEV